MGKKSELFKLQKMFSSCRHVSNFVNEICEYEINTIIETVLDTKSKFYLGLWFFTFKYFYLIFYYLDSSFWIGNRLFQFSGRSKDFDCYTLQGSGRSQIRKHPCFEKKGFICKIEWVWDKAKSNLEVNEQLIWIYKHASADWFV